MCVPWICDRFFFLFFISLRSLWKVFTYKLYCDSFKWIGLPNIQTTANEFRKASASCSIKWCDIWMKWQSASFLIIRLMCGESECCSWRECLFNATLYRACMICRCITVGATRNTGHIQTDDGMQFQFKTPSIQIHIAECNLHTVGVDFSLSFCNANSTKSSFWQMKRNSGRNQRSQSKRMNTRSHRILFVFYRVQYTLYVIERVKKKNTQRARFYYTYTQ